MRKLLASLALVLTVAARSHAIGLGGDAGNGAVPDATLDASSVTLQGNTFNAASKLVQLNGSTQLPAVSGALLTNLAGAQVGSGVPAANIAAGSLGSSVIASSIAAASVGSSQLTSGVVQNQAYGTFNPANLASLASGTTFYGYTPTAALTMTKISLTIDVAGIAGSGNGTFECEDGSGNRLSVTVAVDAAAGTYATASGTANIAAGAKISCDYVSNETTKPSFNGTVEFKMQ